MLKILDPQDAWKRNQNFVSSYNFFMVTLYSQLYDEANEKREHNKSSLDSLDASILKALSDNPTITQRLLAEMLGVHEEP